MMIAQGGEGCVGGAQRAHWEQLLLQPREGESLRELPEGNGNWARI